MIGDCVYLLVFLVELVVCVVVIVGVVVDVGRMVVVGMQVFFIGGMGVGGWAVDVVVVDDLVFVEQGLR